MELEILLSGLLGALIATFISVIYLHISEKNKLRGEVFLEVVSYCDEIYHFLQTIHNYKEAEFRSFRSPYSSEEYISINNKLTVSLVSTKEHAKLILAYGEGEASMLFSMLSNNLIKVSSILRNSTKSAWVTKEHKEIMRLFSEEIDPLRANLQNSMLNGTRYLPTLYKFTQYLKLKSHNKSSNLTGEKDSPSS